MVSVEKDGKDTFFPTLPLYILLKVNAMKNQIMLVMFAMLVTVFVVVPMSYITVVLNVGVTASLLYTMVTMLGSAINLHIENGVRAKANKPVAEKVNESTKGS